MEHTHARTHMHTHTQTLRGACLLFVRVTDIVADGGISVPLLLEFVFIGKQGDRAETTDPFLSRLPQQERASIIALVFIPNI